MGKSLWEMMEGAKGLIEREKVRAFRVLDIGVSHCIALCFIGVADLVLFCFKEIKGNTLHQQKYHNWFWNGTCNISKVCLCTTALEAACPLENYCTLQAWKVNRA